MNEYYISAFVAITDILVEICQNCLPQEMFFFFYMIKKQSFFKKEIEFKKIFFTYFF